VETFLAPKVQPDAQMSFFTPEDLLCIPISVGDYVVFHNCIYQVVALGNAQTYEYSPRAEASIRLKLLNAGKTNKPVVKRSQDVVKVPAESVERLQKWNADRLERIRQLNS
jgi:hypothetical protein